MKKGLTLYQPHATLMIIGAKTVETRPKKWSYVGPLVIHAGLFKGWLHLCFTEPFKSALDQAGISVSELSFGKIIGEVTMLGCDKTEEVRDQLSSNERAFGDYGNKRYAYSTVYPIRYAQPIPHKGKQGVFNL